jgi:2-polyprenyl-6-methoxyphenol hydroxylase-like FAD-dependent oxidoreductase
VAHRTIIPMKDAPASLQKRQGVTMWTGDGFHVIYYPLRNATELNLVLVVRLPEGVHNISDEAYKVHIDELMQQVTPEARDAMALMNLERRWAIADRTPIRHWSQGRMTLLGDSAHATLQSLAQGAGMAFEDALVLSELVKKHGDDFSSAFKELQRLRFLRTSRVQLESRALWDVYHCAGVDAEVRTQQFKEKTPEDFYRCLDWLWKPISLSV